MTNDLKILLAMSVFAFVTSFRPRTNNLLQNEFVGNLRIKQALPHMLGISFGFLVMSIVLGSGFERVFREVPLTYPFIKILSFLLLLYLTWRIASADTFKEIKIERPQSLGFTNATFAQWLSPSTWLITILLFGNYLPENPSIIFLLTCSFTFSLISLMAMSLWAISDKKFTIWFTRPSYQEAFNLIMAALLILSMLTIF